MGELNKSFPLQDAFSHGIITAVESKLKHNMTHTHTHTHTSLHESTNRYLEETNVKKQTSVVSLREKGK